VYKKYLRLLFLLVGVVTFLSTFRLAIVASNADTLITNVAIADEENALVFHTWDEREKHLLGMGVSPALVGALHAYDTNLREAIDRGASEQELIRITDEFNKLSIQLANDSISNGNWINQTWYSHAEGIWASCANGPHARWYRPGDSNYSEFVKYGGSIYGLAIPSGSGWVHRHRDEAGSWESHIAWSTGGTPSHDYASCS
jgi:hypothetical protein